MFASEGRRYAIGAYNSSASAARYPRDYRGGLYGLLPSIEQTELRREQQVVRAVRDRREEPVAAGEQFSDRVGPQGPAVMTKFPLERKACIGDVEPTDRTRTCSE